MAKRDQDKAKRYAVRPTDAAAGLAEAVHGLEARARSLERERDGLKLELEAARRRIAELEDQRSQVINRIEWAIDSLHNLIEVET